MSAYSSLTIFLLLLLFNVLSFNKAAVLFRVLYTDLKSKENLGDYCMSCSG